jgi:hypothetical protein
MTRGPHQISRKLPNWWNWNGPGHNGDPLNPEFSLNEGKYDKREICKVICRNVSPFNQMYT